MAFNKPFCRSNTFSYKWDTPQLSREHPAIIPFSVADSDYPTARTIVKAIKRRCCHGAFGYTYVDDGFRDTVVSWVGRHYGYRIKPDWVLTSPGVVSALYWSVHAYTAPGDTVVIQPPVYRPFYQVVTNAGRILALNRLKDLGTKYEIDYNDLEDKFKSGAKMMILCSPHNPVGRVWTKPELERLVNLAKKYNVTLVSDEIHCDFILFGNRFTSLGAYVPDYKKIIVLFAPSKTFNIAGLDLACVIAPDDVMRKELVTIFSENFISASNPLSIAAARAAFSKSDQWLSRQIIHLENNIQYLYGFFQKNIPEAVLYKIEGTYLVWIKISFLEKPADQVTAELIDYGIAVNSGTMYGAAYSDYIRFNVACCHRQLKKGLEKFYRYAEDNKNEKLRNR
ncbi:MAG: PatB family C-S lyase [Bacilli bacterium]|nr:PatB family C-S lyase [Bacilli bacterium]